MKNKSLQDIKIFSFSFIFQLITNVVALSTWCITHPNKHNNQQFNVKPFLQKKIPILVRVGMT